MKAIKKAPWLPLYVLSAVLGYVIGAHVGFAADDVDSCVEFEAYRHCLQAAGQYQCQMTPEDFVRYYELKYLLQSAPPSDSCSTGTPAPGLERRD